VSEKELSKALKQFFCKHDDCKYYLDTGKKKRKILCKHNDFIVEIMCRSCKQFSTLTIRETEKIDNSEEAKLLLDSLKTLKAKNASKNV